MYYNENSKLCQIKVSNKCIAHLSLVYNTVDPKINKLIFLNLGLNSASTHLSRGVKNVKLFPQKIEVKHSIYFERPYRNMQLGGTPDLERTIAFLRTDCTHLKWLGKCIIPLTVTYLDPLPPSFIQFEPA